MEINDLKQQENVEAILAETTGRAWSHELASRYSVNRQACSDAQPWILQPRLSAMLIPGASRAVRSFMVERFRFTPVLTRLPFQWLYGTLLGTPAVIRRIAPTFWVSPPVPGAKDRLVIPGSRRVRTFDFQRCRTRSVVKFGFPESAIAAEIALRTSSTGPFLPILSSDPQGTEWFEEEIVPGFPLPRCPTWWDTRSIERRALNLLREWLDRFQTTRDAEQYVGKLLASITKNTHGLEDKFSGSSLNLPMKDRLARIGESARQLKVIQAARTHGDFQPGNIHVGRDHREPLIIDWEFTEDRHFMYDFLTYGLKARYPAGFSKRFASYIRTGDAGPSTLHLRDALDPLARQSLADLFLLEELDRLVRDAVNPQYVAPPFGFRHFTAEMSKIDWGLALR